MTPPSTQALQVVPPKATKDEEDRPRFSRNFIDPFPEGQRQQAQAVAGCLVTHGQHSPELYPDLLLFVESMSNLKRFGKESVRGRA